MISNQSWNTRCGLDIILVQCLLDWTRLSKLMASGQSLRRALCQTIRQETFFWFKAGKHVNHTLKTFASHCKYSHHKFLAWSPWGEDIQMQIELTMWRMSLWISTFFAKGKHQKSLEKCVLSDSKLSDPVRDERLQRKNNKKSDKNLWVEHVWPKCTVGQFSSVDR